MPNVTFRRSHPFVEKLIGNFGNVELLKKLSFIACEGEYDGIRFSCMLELDRRRSAVPRMPAKSRSSYSFSPDASFGMRCMPVADCWVVLEDASTAVRERAGKVIPVEIDPVLLLVGSGIDRGRTVPRDRVGEGFALTSVTHRLARHELPEVVDVPARHLRERTGAAGVRNMTLSNRVFQSWLAAR